MNPEPSASFRPIDQSFPIVLIAFDRPAYFERVIRSLTEQIDANLGGRPIALFQDGAFNPMSGRPRADERDIERNIEIFRAYFPNGQLFRSPHNLCVALNLERAEKFVFEELNARAGLFFEDDLVLSPHYVNALDQLLDLALRDERIGYVGAYGVQGPESKIRLGEPIAFHPLSYLWGFGLTRRQWLRNKPYVDTYLNLVRNVDYRERDTRAIYRLFTSWGQGCPSDSQDCAKNLASRVNGVVNLNTSVCFGHYIGREGLHMQSSLYDFVGYDHTAMFEGRLTSLPRLGDEEAARIASVHEFWAKEIDSPFAWETDVCDLDLWNFMVRLYRNPAAEPWLILLQDKYNLSIEMLLFCCWHGANERQLSEADIDRANISMKLWNMRIAGNLRDIRRATGEVSFLNSINKKSLFPRRVFALEIEARKTALAELQQICMPGPTKSSALDNLVLYMRSVDLDLSRVPEIRELADLIPA